MEAVAALLHGMPLQSEESDRGDLMEAKSQLFLKYFTLFMNLLNDCSEGGAGGSSGTAGPAAAPVQMGSVVIENAPRSLPPPPPPPLAVDGVLGGPGAAMGPGPGSSGLRYYCFEKNQKTLFLRSSTENFFGVLTLISVEICA